MKTMFSLVATAAALPLLAGSASAQWQFQFLGTVDLSVTANGTAPEYIGSNPSGVAWNGTDLFVSGFNNSGGVAPTALIKVSGALSGTPTFGPVFGQNASTPSLRGYSGLDIRGNTLVAAYDPGSAVPNGITGYDLSGNLLFSANARGGSGVGIDPGPGGNGDPAGSGAGWTSFGSGRRSLNDLATGAVIYDSSNGMIINGAGSGTFWRDMDFDDATGDIYLREGNNVIKAVRTGNNSCNAATFIVDEIEADFVSGQNLAFIDGAIQDVVIYNKREGSALTPTFFESVTVVDTNGNVQSVDWGTYTPPAGIGYYDFSYDAASGTIAILNFTSRTVDIFTVAEVPPGSAYCFGDGSGAFCPCAGFGSPGEGCLTTSGTGATLSGAGNATIGADTLVLSVAGGPANKPGIFFQGNNQLGGGNGNPVGDGLLCTSGGTIRYAVNALDATGATSQGGFSVNASAGQTLNYQYWFRDTGNACGGGFNFTNGWTQTWN
jgi:hypothetical protein